MEGCIKLRKKMTLLLLLSVCIFAAGNAYADIWQIDIEGAIGPATADHMIRGLEQAQAAEAELVLLRIDTPGGLDLSMRDMIKAILAARVPVVGYVAPGGARASPGRSEEKHICSPARKCMYLVQYSLFVCGCGAQLRARGESLRSS